MVERRVRRRARPRRVRARRSPRSAPTSPGSCRATPRARATTSRSEVVHAASEEDAVEVGRSVARNNLFKAAIFGNDPNWGRVLAAIGTTEAEFDPYDVDVWMNGVRVCSGGRPRRAARGRRPHPARRLRSSSTSRSATPTATILTNDLTHDYVHENSAYSS